MALHDCLQYVGTTSWGIASLACVFRELGWRSTRTLIRTSEGSDTGGNHVHLHRNQLEIRVRNQKSNSSARSQKSDTILG